MSVELSPSSQLAFARPLTQVITKTLVIFNHNAEPVAFKVKTTAPKQYCVRPNSGRIEPGEKVEVSVLLQPMREEPPAGVKCKDKFLVQSALITSDKEVLSLPEVWSSIEREDRSHIHEQKIRCVYLETGDDDRGDLTEGDKSTLIDGSPNTLVNGANSPSTPSNTRTAFHQADTTLPISPSPVAVSNSMSATTGLPSSAANLPPPLNSLGPAPSSSFPPPTAISASAAPASALSEVERLRAEVRDLKQQLSDASNPTAVTGLRKRGGGAAESNSNPQVAQLSKDAIQQGVPLEVVAALCFGVFVVTYIFF